VPERKPFNWTERQKAATQPKGGGQKAKKSKATSKDTDPKD